MPPGLGVEPVGALDEPLFPAAETLLAQIHLPPHRDQLGLGEVTGRGDRGGSRLSGFAVGTHCSLGRLLVSAAADLASFLIRPLPHLGGQLVGTRP